MSTYTCPHCGERGLSTQKRHNCPEAPSLSIPLGPPRARDPIANEYIDRLTRKLKEAWRERSAARAEALTAQASLRRVERELEAARKLIRELVDDEDAGIVWTGTGLVCAYCTATALYDVEHDRDCPIVRARRALAKDTEGGYADPPAYPARMAQPDEEIAL